ncbi:INO80 complex subunit 4 [Escovopsis weberi]|uniref:INO80 complex subunit 4 n=1 Tax=Escovopsis weberi TaxID=150374 RepID=A0A0M8MY37_ESCWE|nr:INO80 complex subunit 4 [Escovopsis weberi]
MASNVKIVEGRRKSASAKPSLTIMLRVSPPRLRALLSPAVSGDDSPPPASEPKEVKESPEVKVSPASPNASAVPGGANLPGDVAGSDSNAATPAAEGTPAPSVMGPPTEGAKKKGVKRSATAANGANDGLPRQRGRPGPKKKARMLRDDGTDAAGAANRATGGHKLGPKANQGAINAGLRALDRSGKPCRKWARGSFKLKSFTGVVWEIHRWTAPSAKTADSTTEESAAPSAESSHKEVKQDDGNEGHSMTNSNSAVDVEMTSVLSMQASSPAPMAVAAAS